MAIGDLLQGALARGAPVGSNVDFYPRVPMNFSSRLRLSTDPVIRVNAVRHYHTDSFMTTIPMQVNPRSIRWSQPKRITKKDTQEGSVYFHFANKKGQNNDILTLFFEGSTGNIDLRGSLGDPNEAIRAAFRRDNERAAGTTERDTGALLKFLVWHNLYVLTREPMILDDGQENIFFINYASKLYPEGSGGELLFQGHFSQNLEFTETAEKPNSQQYSFEFRVQSVFPDLDHVLSVLNANMTDAAGIIGQEVTQVAGPLGLSTVETT